MKKFVFFFSFLLLFGFAKAADSGLESELESILKPGNKDLRKENERLRAKIALKDNLLNIAKLIFLRQKNQITSLTEELQAKNQQITNQNAEMQAYRTAHQTYAGMISKYRWNIAKTAFTTALFSSLATYGCIKLFNWFS